MIKIIVCVIIAISSVFAITPNITSTYADAIEGNPGTNTPFSNLVSFFNYDRVNATYLFNSEDYENLYATNIYNYDGFYNLNADFNANPYSKNANTGYYDGSSVRTGMRPSQYMFSLNGASSLRVRFRTTLYFNAFDYTGPLSLQLPMFYYSAGVALGVNNFTNSWTFGFYYTTTESTNVQLTDISVVKSDTYTLATADITASNITAIDLYYETTFTTSSLGGDNNAYYFTYNFTNILLGNTSNYDYELGYLAGQQNANSTVNSNSASYQAGYTAGVEYQKNNIDTSSASYQAGYTAGSNGANSLNNLFSGVLQAPVDVVLTALNFEIFGVNVSAFVLSLLTIGFIVIILKLLL